MQLGFLKKLFATRSFSFMNVVMWIQYMDGQKSRKSSTRRESIISSGGWSKGKQYYHHPCSSIYIWADTSLYAHRGHKSKPGFKHYYKSVQKTYLKMKRPLFSMAHHLVAWHKLPQNILNCEFFHRIHHF